MLVHDIDCHINWHIKDQLDTLEKEGFKLLSSLGSEGNAGDACRTYLSLRNFWEALRKEISKGNEELTTYSFRHGYAYYGHNRAKDEGGYRAPKQIAVPMGQILKTHLFGYSRFQTKDLASAFNETSLLLKEKF